MNPGQQWWTKLMPTRHQIIDAVTILALTSVALAGFRSAYGGWSFLVVGVVGAVLGIAVAHLTHRLAMGPWLGLLAGVVGLVLLGGLVAARDDAMGGVVPVPAAFPGFVDGLVSGWKRLLTSVPPTGSLGNLLAIAFALAYVCAWLTTLLARSQKRQASVLLLPGLVLAASVLFGTRRPYSVFVQGCVLAGLAIAWLAIRRARQREQYVGSSGRRRAVGAAVMLGATAIAGFAIGPSLPLAASNERYVLRDRNEPPFDPREFGSPLNAFQRYLVGEWKHEVLFTVDGLPEPDPGDKSVYLRLAVLDDYDGVVWRVSPRSGTQGGRFVRVGEEVPVDAAGHEQTIQVTIGAQRGAWIPATGVVTGLDWLTPDARVDQLRDGFRLSTVTSTGATRINGGLQEGDAYQLEVILPAPLTDADVVSEGIDTQTIVDVSSPIPEPIRTLANTITKGKASPLEQAKALEEYFRAGYYASGDDSLDDPNAPGHSYARLIDFIAEDKPVGNAEQYAAAMALMARSLDLPARVVMGFRLDPGASEVLGSDVHAWVEIGFASGWKRFEPTSERHEKPENTQTKPRAVFESQDLPPPPVIPPEPEVNARQGQAPKREKARSVEEETTEDEGGRPIALIAAAVGGIPVVGVGLFAAVVAGLKARRRRKRRRAGDASRQVAGGWAEFVDTARDLKLDMPQRSTRYERATALGVAGATKLAAQADAAVFGADTVPPEWVAEYWSEVDNARRELRKPVPIHKRLAASLSTTSLRSDR